MDWRKNPETRKERCKKERKEERKERHEERREEGREEEETYSKDQIKISSTPDRPL